MSFPIAAQPFGGDGGRSECISARKRRLQGGKPWRPGEAPVRDSLLCSPRDTALGQVIGGHFHLYLITRQYANEVHSQFA